MIDNKIKLELINNVILKVFNKKKDYNSLIDSFSSVYEYIKTNNFKLSFTELETIINNNSLFKKSIELIYNSTEGPLTNKLESYLDNTLLVKSLIAYDICKKKNIIEPRKNNTNNNELKSQFAIKNREGYKEELKKLSPEMKKYYKYAMSVKSLSKIEEQELIKEIRTNNNQDAKKKLIEANLKRVFPIAYRFIDEDINYSFEDLIQMGNDILTKIVKYYNEEWNISFSRYASEFIYKQIRHRKNYRKKTDLFECDVLKSYKEEFIKENGRRPSITEINSFSCGVKKNRGDVQDLSVSFEEDLENNDYVNKSILQNDKITSILTERELEILKLRYGFYGGTPLTLREVGEYFGLSKERINIIEKNAMRKLDFYVKPISEISRKEYLIRIEKALKSELSELLNIMPYKEALIYCLKNGIINETILTNEEIANLLNVKIEIVNYLYEKVLKYIEEYNKDEQLKKIR